MVKLIVKLFDLPPVENIVNLRKSCLSIVQHELRLIGPKLCVCEDAENAELFV